MDKDFVRFVFFNVGHGACTLISLPPVSKGKERRYGVIDCYYPDAAIVDAFLQDPPLKDLGETGNKADPCVLEFVALTHYHNDHMLGITTLLGGNRSLDGLKSRFTTLRFIGPHIPPNLICCPSDRQIQFDMLYDLTWRKAKYLKNFNLFAYDHKYRWGKDIDQSLELFGIAPTDVTKALCINKERSFPINNLHSGGLCIKYGSTVAIICGDIMQTEWERIFKDIIHYKENILSANLILVPHHGGSGNTAKLWNNSSRLSKKSLIDTIKPFEEKRTARTIAVISCANNEKSIPHQNTLTILADVQTQTICTNSNPACIKAYAEQKKDPPCIIDQQKTNHRFNPTHITGIKPVYITNESLLFKQYEVTNNLFDGTVIVDLFRDQKPEIYHLGRQNKVDCVDIFKE